MIMHKYAELYLKHVPDIAGTITFKSRLKEFSSCTFGTLKVCKNVKKERFVITFLELFPPSMTTTTKKSL